MVEIIWDESIQPQNKAEIERHLMPYIFLCPPWCSRITIYLVCANADFAAQIDTCYEYRTARLEIATDWLDYADEMKSMKLIHELCHNFYNPLYHFARENFDILLSEAESSKYRKSIGESLRMLNESGTEDLAKVIYDKLKGI